MSFPCFCVTCDPPKILPPEEWRSFFDGYYEVSNHGNIRRAKPGTATFVGRPVRPVGSPMGYFQVQLQSPTQKRRAYVHHLVAEAFIGPREKGIIVNHKDANKTNNAADNLEYVTPRQNVQHALATVVRRKGPTKPVAPLKGPQRGDRHWTRLHPERIARADKMPHTKINEDSVRAMRAERIAGAKVKDLSAKYGLSQAQTSRILNGTRWSYVK